MFQGRRFHSEGRKTEMNDAVVIFSARAVVRRLWHDEVTIFNGLSKYLPLYFNRLAFHRSTHERITKDQKFGACFPSFSNIWMTTITWDAEAKRVAKELFMIRRSLKRIFSLVRASSDVELLSKRRNLETKNRTWKWCMFGESVIPPCGWMRKWSFFPSAKKKKLQKSLPRVCLSSFSEDIN